MYAQWMKQHTILASLHSPLANLVGSSLGSGIRPVAGFCAEKDPHMRGSSGQMLPLSPPFLTTMDLLNTSVHVALLPW
jgi:hypothetical protein